MLGSYLGADPASAAWESGDWKYTLEQVGGNRTDGVAFGGRLSYQEAPADTSRLAITPKGEYTFTIGQGWIPVLAQKVQAQVPMDVAGGVLVAPDGPPRIPMTTIFGEKMSLVKKLAIPAAIVAGLVAWKFRG
jgi:hypothetical protein